MLAVLDWSDDSDCDVEDETDSDPLLVDSLSDSGDEKRHFWKYGCASTILPSSQINESLPVCGILYQLGSLPTFEKVSLFNVEPFCGVEREGFRAK